MATVKIYLFQAYDISSDQVVKSRRWATPEAIAKIPHATLILDTEIEVDESAINSDIFGMTAIGFNPHSLQGFQTEVKRGY